jgi:hypothetical protein
MTISMRPDHAKKKAVPEGTAKFREETSKKSSGRQGLVAASTKIGAVSGRRKQFFCSAA